MMRLERLGSPQPPRSPRRWALERARWVMVTVIAAMVLAALPLFLTGALSPLLEGDLGVGRAGTGAAISALFVAAAVASLPAGRLVDRIGAAVGLRVAALLGGGVGIGIAGFVGSLPTLVAALCVGGITIAITDTSCARALTRAVVTTRQGIGFGLKEASIPTASLLAGLSIPVLGERFGWRAAYLAGGVASLLFAMLVPKGIERAGPRPTHRDDGPPRTATTAHASQAPAPTANPSTTVTSDVQRRDHEHHGLDDRTGFDGRAELEGRAELDDRTGFDGRDGLDDRVEQPAAAGFTAGSAAVPKVGLILASLSIAAGLAGAAAAGLSTFLVPSHVEAGLGIATAGIVLAVSSLAAVTGRIVFGGLADRTRTAALPMFTMATGTGALALLGLAGLSAAAGPASATITTAVLLTVVSVVAFGAGWGWTGLVFLTAVRLDPQRPAAAASTTLLGLALGGASGPAIVGVVAQRTGFPTAWLLCSLAMGLATLVLMGVQHRLRHRP